MGGKRKRKVKRPNAKHAPKRQQNQKYNITVQSESNLMKLEDFVKKTKFTNSSKAVRLYEGKILDQIVEKKAIGQLYMLTIGDKNYVNINGSDKGLKSFQKSYVGESIHMNKRLRYHRIAKKRNNQRKKNGSSMPKPCTIY